MVRNNINTFLGFLLLHPGIEIISLINEATVLVKKKNSFNLLKALKVQVFVELRTDVQYSMYP